MKVLKSIILVLGFMISFMSKAQFTIQANQNTYKSGKKLDNVVMSTAPLTLPFLEDFSTTTTSFPDECNWKDAQSVFVNNSFPINPPSYNVATLDGLNSTGTPYQTLDPLAQGNADDLTSQVIDLSVNSVADSVYISFFWQLKGFGETPDIQDFLILELKDKDGNWNNVWEEQGGDPDIKPNVFNQQLIKIADEKYFHNAFQFRFRNTARLSGAFDTWHLDYIYININRKFNDYFREDVATVNNPGFLLSQYSAMPINHYFLDPNAQTTKVLNTLIFNSDKVGDFNVVDYDVIIEDLNTNTLITTLPNPGIPIIINGQETQDLSVNVPDNLLSSTTTALKLKTTFRVNTTEDNTIIPPFDLSQNDDISSITVLDDYYAYDDGTAEYGAGINQRFGRVAYQFELPEKDFLTDIKIHFTRIGKDLTGQTFILTVWKDLENSESSILYQKSFPVTYPTTRGEFINYKIDIPLELEAGTYYIGWRQTTNDRLNVGFDKNTDSGDKIFFNVDGKTWIPNTENKGSLLFRPVFGSDVVSALDDDLDETILMVYPNPASSAVYVSGENLTRLQIYDLRGRKMLDKKLVFSEPKHKIDIQYFPKATYIIKAINQDNKVITKKLIIR